MDDSEEEDVIVYASFEKGTIEKDMFNVPDLHWKIIGLESDTPILQLGDTTFKGEWNDTIGTKLLFEEDPSPEQVDAAFTVLPPTMLKYTGQTNKTIDFSRIFLKPKNTENNESANVSEVSTQLNKDILNLAESTITPSEETSEIMKNIVDETTAEM